jgi:integrase
MPTPVLRRADNGRYYAFYTVGRRSKRESMGTTQEGEARKRFAQWLLVESEPGEDAARLTCGDLWDLYWEKHAEVKTASPATLRFSWANLKVHFEALPISAVDQDVVDRYERARNTGRIGRKSKSSTVRRELNALRGCFSWCADPKRRIITKAQIPAFSLPEEGEARDRWLKMPEIQALLDTARQLRKGDRLSRGERFLWLALETAARKSAILELTWDRVDFETGVIHYDVPGRKKTKKRRSAPPISKALRPVLRRAYAERTSDLVLDNPFGIDKVVKAIALAAGVKGVSPHVLRHTAATHMARNGVPLWKIAGVLGNSMLMVEKVYAKHCPEGLADAVEAISRGVLEPAE